MLSETIEFVNDYFNDTFHPVINEEGKCVYNDPRIQALKKYCNTVTNMRRRRVEKGYVISSVQIMDNLKYTEASLHTLLKRIDSGELKLYDDGKEICDVVIAFFSDIKEKESGNSYSWKYKTNGWKGSMSEFMEVMMNVEEKEQGEYKPKSKNFYLKSFPETIISEEEKKNVEFFIFGVLVKSDSSEYDNIAITIIGMPKNREIEIHERNVKRMFGYI